MTAPGGPVVFIMRQFAIGGLERVVLMQARMCADAGYDVTILILDGGAGNSLVVECDPRVAVRVLPGGTAARRRVLADVCAGATVLLHFGYGRLYPRLRAALWGAGAQRIVRFCHSDYSRLRSAGTNAADRLFGRTDEMVAVGGGAEGFLVDVVGMAPERVRNLPNIAPLPPGPRQPAAGLRLLTVSDVEPHKAVGDVVTALAATASPLALRLSVVGDGSDLIGVWQRAREAGVLDRVDWYGAIWHQPTVLAMFAAADVFISMSRAEGIPLSVLEAVRTGVPHIVLSDIPGHRAAAGQHALYVDPRDTAALAGILDDISADHTLGTGPVPPPSAPGPDDGPRDQTYEAAAAGYRAALMDLVAGTGPLPVGGGAH